MPVKGKEILMIDDAADVRLRCRRVLESFGIVVFEAGSGLQGLEYLSRAKKVPDLILLDLQMTGKSGFDFLATRKASLLISAVPVIVLSGLNDKLSIAKAIGMGANDYMLKPVNSTTLFQRVRKRLLGPDFQELSLESRHMKAELELDATVTRVEDASVTIESCARVTKGTSIELPSATLQDLKLSAVVLIAESDPGPLTMSRRYQTALKVVGLKDPVRCDGGNS